MDKTKVILTPDMLEFRQAIAELVNQVCEENLLISMNRDILDDLPPRTDIAELWTPGLLSPPKIEMLWPDIWLTDGHLDGLIQIATSEEYGVMEVFVVLEDADGNRLESDYAIDPEVVENQWGYFPSAPVAPGTTVIVRAIALDRLWQVGIRTERITV